MRAFKLNEISGVTRPAQGGALVAIMKRDFSDDERQALADKGQALADGSYPIVTTSDLKNAVQSYGRAKDPQKVKAHIIARAKALGATDALPDGWVSKSAGDPDMSIKKALGLPETATEAEATAAAERLSKGVDDALAAKKADNETIAKLKADLAKADMSDKHTAFMNNDKAKMPSGGKAAFQAMSPSEREAHCSANPIGGDDASKSAEFAAAVAKAAANDEVLKVGDLEIRKSAVGDANFAIFKAQQAEIAKERDARELLEFQKKAETDFAALPGEPIAKAKALRAIGKLDETDRKALEAMLKSGNDARRGTFKELGKGGGDGADTSSDKLEAMAKTHAEAHKVSFAKAYDAVLKTDEGAALYAASRRVAA